MIYRKYGSSGIDVSVISCGGMRFGDDPEKAAELIKSAYDCGINYFDTAPGYGKSEEFYGIALKEMKKTRKEKPFYVATKTFGEDPSGVRKDLDNSLQRMGIEHIDFYHVWCILSIDDFRERRRNGVLKEFEKIRSEGLAKHICVSTHMNGDEIKEMLDEYPFEGVLLGYSPMNSAYRDAALNHAAGLSKAVIVMNPLGGGLIPNNPELFSFLKTREKESVVEAALRLLINDGRITSSLVGFSTKEQLDEAISAVNGFKPISQAKIKERKIHLKKSFNEMCTACRYCDECPAGIPVPKFMDVFNMHLLTKKEDAIVNRLKWHWSLSAEEATKILDKCSECGLCERKCTQKLPIISRLKKIKEKLGSVKH